jgi:hypothetical protein
VWVRRLPLDDDQPPPTVRPRHRHALRLVPAPRHECAGFDLYRDEPPDPMDISKFQWQVILSYLGATDEEIRDCPDADGEALAVGLGPRGSGLLPGW